MGIESSASASGGRYGTAATAFAASARSRAEASNSRTSSAKLRGPCLRAVAMSSS